MPIAVPPMRTVANSTGFPSLSVIFPCILTCPDDNNGKRKRMNMMVRRFKSDIALLLKESNLFVMYNNAVSDKKLYFYRGRNIKSVLSEIRDGTVAARMLINSVNCSGPLIVPDIENSGGSW